MPEDRSQMTEVRRGVCYKILFPLAGTLELQSDKQRNAAQLLIAHCPLFIEKQAYQKTEIR